MMTLLHFVQCLALLSVAVLAAHTDVAYAETTTASGFDFYIGIPSTYLQPPHIYLVIDNPATTSTSYSVETSAGIIFANGVLGVGSINYIYLNNSLQVYSSEYSDRYKGIRIRSTSENPISVLVATLLVVPYPSGFSWYKSHQNQEIDSKESFEYFALSTDYNGQLLNNRRSELLLIGNHNSTVISIIPTQTVHLPQDAQDPSSDLVSVAPGSIHNVTLHQFQTLLVFNLTHDITGTRIVSNKPLTVLTGHQCAQIPTHVSYCDPIHVQVPPSFLWGQKFILSPFAGRKSEQYYKLVTAKEDTTIAYKCGNSAAIELAFQSAGHGKYLNFSAGSYCSLVATKPIFIVQLGAGYTADNYDGGPVMTVVSPTSRHVNSVSFLSLPFGWAFPSSFISITVLKKHFNNHSIFLDGNAVQCSWNAVYDTSGIAGYVCSLRMSDYVYGSYTAKHIVYHCEEDGLLSVVAYGWNNDGVGGWGYAYLTGMNTAEEISVKDRTSQKLSFFNLSSIDGVMELPRQLDASSPPIYLPDYIYFGNQIVTTVYVNENGVLSFDKPFKFSHPSRFPPENIYARQNNIVAPFWSDNDIRKNGTVRYVDIVKGYSTQGDMLLEIVAEHVNSTLGTKSSGRFQPTWMIVAQWDKVHPHPHGADSHDGISEDYLSKTNTYQAIIASDRVDTYILFTYTCGEVQWSGQDLNFAVVGYNSHGDHFSNHFGNGFEDIADIISCSRAGQLNRKPCATNYYELMIKTSESMLASFKKCFDLVKTDVLMNHNIQLILENLPTCPSGDQVKQDKLFEYDRSRKSGNICYRSKVYYRSKDSHDQLHTFVQQCCYYSGGLIKLGKDAGSLLDISNGSYHDDQMYEHCCIEDTNCKGYRSRRPINNGTGYIPPYLGWGWGDPHYGYFDDKITPFNTFKAPGSHYYNIMQVTKSGSVVFTLQALINDLLIKSMAFGIKGIESYQYGHQDTIQLLDTSGSTAINLTQQISALNSAYKGNRFEIRRFDSRVVQVIDFEMHIVVQMHWHTSHMGFQVQLPSFICNNSLYEVSGHLGNCDGVSDSNNTVTHPQGIIDVVTEGLFMISSSRKKRQTPGTDDCIPAEVCENAPNFEDLNFTDAQRQFCNDIESCLYDLAVTGSEEFAGTSRDFDSNKTETTEILNNYPPVFTANSTFNVIVGLENIYTFKVEDVDSNFTISIEGGAEGQLLNSGAGLYTFRWTVSVTPTNSLIFRAVDTRGAAALLIPVLHVCTCYNGGECTSDGIIDSASFIINMTCTCTEAFDGESCLEDRNGCSEIECFEGVECLDVPAPGVGAVCGPCPTGYTGDGLKCFDINECSADSSLCDQTCENTVGSYSCNCYTGFMLTGSQCQDIDECSGVNNCQQECSNTVGSYTCSCLPGFNLNSDNTTCTPQQMCTDPNSCSHICAVIGETEICFCPIGLEISSQNSSACVDIDECDRFSPCDQVCINSVGSFMCSCESGYELEEDMRICTDIDECKIAALSSTQLCFNDTQCLNTLGLYNCTCVSGYNLVNNTCERYVEALPEVLISPPPTSGLVNSYAFVVQTHSRSELTSEKLQDFRVSSAKAITRFCESFRDCSLIMLGKEIKVTELEVKPQHIALPVMLITVNGDGKPVLRFYVQLNSTTFVTAATISRVIERALDIYIEAGFYPQDLCNQYAPCQNGATCTNTARGYTCTCAPGYTEKNCTINIDDCVSNPCQNGSTCMDGVNRFECACPPRMTGDRCEEQVSGLPIIGLAVGVAVILLVLVIGYSTFALLLIALGRKKNLAIN